MAISIDWETKIISIPKSYMTLTQASPEIRGLNLNTFRLDLKDLEDDDWGMTFPDTHRHNTEVTLGGITLARTLEIINGYTVTFEDGQYAVEAKEANSNLADVMNVNQVSLRTFNSAGLITVTSGSGLSTEEHNWLMAQDQYSKNIKILKKIDNTLHFIIYDEGGIIPIIDKELKDINGNDVADVKLGIIAQELKSTI